ncbi:UNKNOWN [Stylonychia lemnae]|uniref:Uncharacterized protein n=1 Tax=Stylonychia lemnae TaxID=5949 RepID=A0A078AAS8_STYLE|nr:UNKNOWN [Stylonychia lemnae]|eukprot:CDW77888.1 UNKNOWN [Stylonychia lemnae]
MSADDCKSLLYESQRNKNNVPGNKCNKYSQARFDDNLSYPHSISILPENTVIPLIIAHSTIIKKMPVLRQFPANLYYYAPYDQPRNVSRAPFTPNISIKGKKYRNKFPRAIAFISCVVPVIPINFKLIISGRLVKKRAVIVGIAK